MLGVIKHCFIQILHLYFLQNQHKVIANVFTILGQTSMELKINSIVIKVMKTVVAKDVIYHFILGRNFLEETKAFTIFERKKIKLVTPLNSCHTNDSTTYQIQITTHRKQK